MSAQSDYIDMTDSLAQRIKKGLEALHPFTSTPGQGTTRLPFTKETRAAADCLKEYMAGAGLAVHEDEAGNLIGIMNGANADLPALIVGSHYDSVVNGGNFDGQAGVIAAVEVARMLRDNAAPLQRDYIAIAFMDEEGMRFSTGYFGSKSWLGKITQEELHTIKDKDGISIYDAMKSYGLTPENLPRARWDIDRVKAFVELHIEQGPILDAENIELGLVECIVGIQRYIVTINGRADHAGTTPMDMRMDAAEAAAKVMAKIPDWAREKKDGTVATTGYVKVTPGGVNIVPQEAQFSIDIRSRNNDNLLDIMDKITSELDKVCRENGTTYKMEEKLIITPVSLSQQMLELMEASCKKYGYSHRRMVSGAGHDSLAIGQHVDTVMLFTPSKDGRSHCPVEWTDYSYIAKGTLVIYDLIIDMQ